MAIDHLKIDRWFAPPNGDPAQDKTIEELRLAAHDFATMIIERTPPCADQSAAIRFIRQAFHAASDAVRVG